MTAASSYEDRILTIPNAVTMARLLCFPVFLWLLFARDERMAAAVLLFVLGVTDWVDGQLARRLGQVSTFGKILDPVADRILLGGGVVAILIDGSVPAWVAWATIVREALVSVVVLALAAAGARRIEVQWVGKAGAFALMGAFPAFLASNAGTSADPVFEVLAWLSAIPGLALAWYAAAIYIPLGRIALVEGREARRVSE